MAALSTPEAKCWSDRGRAGKGFGKGFDRSWNTCPRGTRRGARPVAISQKQPHQEEGRDDRGASEVRKGSLHDESCSHEASGYRIHFTGRLQGLHWFAALILPLILELTPLLDDQLGTILTQTLAIPLAEELPTPNARKTCALAIWLIQNQRLPSEVLMPANDRIAYALRRGIEGELGKEGKKGSTNDGLKVRRVLTTSQSSLMHFPLSRPFMICRHTSRLPFFLHLHLFYLLSCRICLLPHSFFVLKHATPLVV